MAWTRLGIAKVRTTSLGGDKNGPDIAVAPRPSWLLIGMVIASTAGLLATTDDQVSYSYQFETSTEGTPADLSANAPSAKFAIKVTVNALGKGDGDTSQNVRLTVHGTIVTTAAPLEATFLEAQLSGRESAGAKPLSVLTDFDFGQGLTFVGDCAHPGGVRPCTAQATLQLARNDAGAHGGVLNIAWNARFDGVVSTSAKVDVPATEAPPWTIEVAPL